MSGCTSIATGKVRHWYYRKNQIAITNMATRNAPADFCSCDVLTFRQITNH